ncbi:conserved hypothetical protein [Treponema primitia ZAS-2]|uniref:PBS lyase HEAT domain protein repeat-containing protein n=1 Tax=Treponema primitia (strain ATCC BAA-887 / DSM 12427 / ZAS-2) TaxID=545694 RepID=F5YMV2_TREPZ|nr:HEAT repeat domain-containing protein [Treponema primitia]AEF85882.1 conserved hypothetical protein [Treponema primitia ZAS-2]
MKFFCITVLCGIFLWPALSVFPQDAPDAAATAKAVAAAAALDSARRLDTIRYGTETEIASLIQALKNENDLSLDKELITVARNTRNRNILSGVFSFFGDRAQAGLEDRALKAIEERDEEANDTVLAAVTYLGNIKSTDAAPYIQELLDSEERPFMSACIKALGLIGGNMPAGDPGKQQAAVAAPEPVPQTESLAGTDPGNGEEGEGDETGGSIPEHTNTARETSLQDARGTASQDKQETASQVAASRRPKEDAAELARYLIDFYNNRSPGDENRREIIVALGDVKSPAGLPLLREIAENNDERAPLRMSALEALAKIGDSDGLDAVLLSVESADPNVRSTAVAALGPFKGSEVDNAIIEAFRDSYYRTRMAAAQAARDRRFVEAVPYLRYRAERDDVPAVKDEAIKALGTIANPEALDILSSLFSERKNADRVRLLSAEMLIQNKADAYTAKLIEELDEAKRKNQTPLYNGFLRVLGMAKTPVLEDLAKRFFFSGGVVEKAYAMDMVANNDFRSLADTVREYLDEKNGSLSRKAHATLEKMGLSG